MIQGEKMYTSKHKGFTLVELLIVVAIISILAAVGFPAYNEQMQKGRRADAKNMVLQIASLQERYHSNFGYYGNADDLTGNDPITSDEGFYSITVACTPTATCTAASRSQQYTITATPNVTDANCGVFTYDQSGTITKSGTKTLAYCW
jgi:type IV pilus assembly protein PilE